MAVSWLKLYESGNLMFGGGIYDAALKKYTEALEFAIESGDQAWIGDSMRAMARTYMALGKLPEAEQSIIQAEQLDRAFWQCENQQVADDMYVHGEVKRCMGDLASAREILEKTLASRLEVLGEDHEDTMAVMIRLIWIDLEDGDSQRTLVQHIKHASTVFARTHPYGGFAKALRVYYLLRPYLQQERQLEAAQIAERLQRAMRSVLGNAHPEITVILSDCSDIMGDADKALTAWRLKSRSEAMNKVTSADLWLTNLEAKNNPGSTDGARPPVNPADEGEAPKYQFPPGGANFPSPFREQPNPFAEGQPNPFEAAAAQQNPKPTGERIVPYDPFSAPSQPAAQTSPPEASASQAPAPNTTGDIAPPQLIEQMPSPGQPPSNHTNTISTETKIPWPMIDPSEYENPKPKTLRSTLSDETREELSSLLHDPTVDQDNDESSTAGISPTNTVHQNYLESALGRAGISTEPTEYAYKWVGFSLVLGAIATGSYICAGMPYLSLQSFMLAYALGTAALFLYLAIAITKHQAKITKNLPDALEIMVSQLQQGEPIGETIKWLAVNGPVALRALFARAFKTMEKGKPLYEAVSEMARYVTAPEMRALADRIRVNQSTGRGLATEVAKIAKDCRDRQSSRGGKKPQNSNQAIIIAILIASLWFAVAKFAFFPEYGALALGSIYGAIATMLFFIAALAVDYALLGPPEAAGWVVYLEHEYARLTERQRRNKIANDMRRELVDFLDMVTMYVEGGMALPQAVMQVARSSTNSCPNLCRELEKTISNLTSFKTALPNTFRQMGREYGVEELIQLGGTIEAATRTQSSVGFQLREQCKAMRNHLKYTNTTSSAGTLIAVLIIVYLLHTLIKFVPH